MKPGRIIEIIVLIILIAICTYFYIKARKEAYLNAKAQDEQLKKEKENTQIFTTVKIDGMMCEKCAARVTEGLSSFGEITIDLEAKTAIIASDEAIDAAKLEKAVTELGYKFEGIE